ncbi:hypothetical protein HUU40_11655 [candidate division KSB1 bacterium]|nr:hypothetical protein [candidate division KSB1 bacterium]
MKELFYFSFADLMARIEYHQEANSLSYTTHRKMTSSERGLVEQYLLNTVALQTEYYKRRHALFIYRGIDPRLTKVLDQLHSKNASREPVVDEKEINDSVRSLISRSMQNYYFEQIGETILEARRCIANGKAGFADDRPGRRKMKLEELVNAYNDYTDQKIAIAEIIPSELKSHFGLPGEGGYFQAAHAVHANFGA